jgi:hypothetical protein
MTRTPLDYTIKAFQLTALSFAIAMTGCGGGSTVDVIAPPQDGSGGNGSNGGNGNGNGDNGDTTAAIKVINSSILDSDGNATTVVGLAGAYYQVKVVDEKGNSIAGAKVSFAIDATGVSLSQSTSGSVLTNAEGIAQVFIKPDSATVTGAYTVSSSVSYNGMSATDEKTFSVQPTNIQLGQLTITDTNLTSGGQTSVSMKVTDSNGVAISGTIINLSASCGQLPAQVTSDADGTAQFVYKAINADGSLCEGTVRLNASSGTVSQTQNLTVQKAEATSIIYTSNELTMGIENSGSSSTGQVQFTVYTDTTPLANTKVKVSLEKSPLGLKFGPNRNSDDFIATTDQNGVIAVNLYPGSTPGPVEIKASLVSDPSINALSKNITVASARVSQSGLSISWEQNVLDWGSDGASTGGTVRMVDRNGNAVPDGTVINFTAEGGKITPSCATTDGACSITFSTQNPRPGDGRVSILAVAEGEKDYIDVNKNNKWDKGEDLFVHNIGDTFRDDNENGTYEPGEFNYPAKITGTGTCDSNNNVNLDRYITLKFPTIPADLKTLYKRDYVRTFVAPNKNNTCNNGLDAIVRNQTISLLSNGEKTVFTIADPSFVIGNRFLNDPNFRAKVPQTISSTDKKVVFRVNSGGFYYLNPMPSGTTITAQGIDNTDAETSKECTVEWSSGVNAVPKVVDTGKPGEDLGTYTGFSIKGCETGDEFKIITTSPNGYTNFKVYPL